VTLSWKWKIPFHIVLWHYLVALRPKLFFAREWCRTAYTDIVLDIRLDWATQPALAKFCLFAKTRLLRPFALTQPLKWMKMFLSTRQGLLFRHSAIQPVKMANFRTVQLSPIHHHLVANHGAPAAYSSPKFSYMEGISVARRHLPFPTCLHRRDRRQLCRTLPSGDWIGYISAALTEPAPPVASDSGWDQS